MVRYVTILSNATQVWSARINTVNVPASILTIGQVWPWPVNHVLVQIFSFSMVSAIEYPSPPIQLSTLTVHSPPVIPCLPFSMIINWTICSTNIYEYLIGHRSTSPLSIHWRIIFSGRPIKHWSNQRISATTLFYSTLRAMLYHLNWNSMHVAFARGPYRQPDSWSHSWIPMCIILGSRESTRFLGEECLFRSRDRWIIRTSDLTSCWAKIHTERIALWQLDILSRHRLIGFLC